MSWWHNPKILEVVDKYDNLQPREQTIIWAGSGVLLFLLLFVALLEPVWLNLSSLREQIQSSEANNQSLLAQIERLENSQYEDPNEKLRLSLRQVMAQGRELDEEIAQVTQSLVAPKQMVSLLESVLSQDKQLKLISLTNKPAEPVELDINVSAADQQLDAETAELEPESLIYRHGFSVEMEATYPATVKYLQSLQGLPWKLFWQQLDYQTEQYPKGTLKIEIYTLSTRQEVLGV